jgi:hypothetical protein
MQDPTLTTISINARVSLERGITDADCRAAITTSLANYFSLLTSTGAPNPLIDFGYNIRTNVMPPGSLQAYVPFSDVFDAVAGAVDTAGLKVCREVDKSSFTPGADVPIADISFPILGSITLFDIDNSVSF